MIRIAAPAPACVAAPAGAIGRAAEAAEAQRKARASGNDAPTERAFSSTKTARPRSAQEIEIRNQACEAERRQAVCSCTQRPTFQRPMNDRPAMRGRKRTRSAAATPAAATRAKPDLDAARARPGCSDRRHRRQRGAVEQADDDQGEADRAETGGLLPGPAAHDGDSDRLVEASRQRHASDRGGTACGGERQRFGAFILGEEPLPAPGLEGVGEQEEDARRRSPGPDPHSRAASRNGRNA